jgi:transcription elongation factor Elf1
MLSLDVKYLRLVSSRLRNFKQKKEGLFNFSCPVCGDSKKNLTKARGYAFAKGNDYFYRCHNCGVSTNVGNLIKHVDTTLYKEYVLERYSSGRTNNANSANAVLQISAPKFGKLQKQKVFEHAEWCDKLPNQHFCLEYLKRRQIPKDVYKLLLFTSKYADFVTSIYPEHGKQLINDARLVIPFYDENDDLIAVSGRALETSDNSLRYVTVRTNQSQNKLIYGLDRIKSSEKILLVEGPLDSLFLNNCLASGDANLALTAKEIDGDITLIFDNEPRNKEILKMMNKAIDTGHSMVIWPESMEGKDINEMVMGGISPSEISDIISSNTFNGITAKLKFNMWKKL